MRELVQRLYRTGDLADEELMALMTREEAELEAFREMSEGR